MHDYWGSNPPRQLLVTETSISLDQSHPGAIRVHYRAARAQTQQDHDYFRVRVRIRTIFERRSGDRTRVDGVCDFE